MSLHFTIVENVMLAQKNFLKHSGWEAYNNSIGMQKGHLYKDSSLRSE